LPPPGWTPDSSWAPLPDGWPLIVDSDDAPPRQEQATTTDVILWVGISLFLMGIAFLIFASGECADFPEGQCSQTGWNAQLVGMLLTPLGIAPMVGLMAAAIRRAG
jgi:uncharacterized membrane protein